MSGPKKPWQPQTWQDLTRFSPLDFSLLSPDFRGLVLLNCTYNTGEKAKIPVESLQWRRRPEIADFLVFPVSRKSPWINFGFEKVKLERNADNFGREFWAWIFWVAWTPGKTRPKNSLSRFAIKIRWEIRRQFSYNSPGQNKKFTPNPLCITSGPRFLSLVVVERVLSMGDWFFTTTGADTSGAAPVKTSTGNNCPRKYQRFPQNDYQYWC